MSRPWQSGTPCPHLEPDVLGQFDTFDDWVSHATRALTGFVDSNGWELKAVCIDATGKRCANGGDFRRAWETGAFPVRYFLDMKPSETHVPTDHVRMPRSVEEARAMSLLAECYLRDNPGRSV